MIVNPSNKLAKPSVGKLISVLRILSRRQSNKSGASARRLRGPEIFVKVVHTLEQHF